MDIFLLGNGFDLHHKFPTSYYDFLQTIQFLINKYDSTYDTVAKIFGDGNLQENDKHILDAYAAHQGVYSLVLLDEKIMQNIVNKAKNNLWFRYLFSCVNKDIGWIDFEKEIITVIQAFTLFLKGEENGLYLNDDTVCFDSYYYPKDRTANHIIRQFDYFFETDQNAGGSNRIKKIKNSYAEENPKGSGVYSLCEEKIVSDLYVNLRELADLLKEYLYHFIDRPTQTMKQMNITPKCSSYPSASHIFTFNYTKTYEVLHNEASVLHLHGDTGSKIVLGVNPDENDEIYNVDTTFLQFKKYYQRILFRTDYNYLNKIKALSRTKNSGDGTTLFVIGHSLDVTDEDIIKELFSLAHKIRILYHDEERIGSYIKNLVNIYGKNEFDNIRAEKELQFLPQAEIEWIYPR